MASKLIQPTPIILAGMRWPRVHFSLRTILALVAAIGWCLACERTIVQQRLHERQWIVEHGGVVEGAESVTNSTLIWRILGGEEESPDRKIPMIRHFMGDQPLWLITIPWRVVTKADDARGSRLFREAPLILQDGNEKRFADSVRCAITPSSGPWYIDVDSDEYDKP